LTQAAIDSVLRQSDSELSEIIVVDDFSKAPLEPRLSNLRSQDKVLRNTERRGAAVSRNRGIDCAEGDIVYLLDSDDEFIDRQFAHDHLELTALPGILYSSIVSVRYSSSYPDSLQTEGYLSAVFGRNRFIGQTSSLCFSASIGLRFDELLPKHQDWDFVFSALKSGVSVRLGKGTVRFDRSDRTSLSRSSPIDRSHPWIDKLRRIHQSDGPLEIDPELVATFLCHGAPYRRNPINAQVGKVVLSSKFTAPEKLKFLMRLAIRAFR